MFYFITSVSSFDKNISKDVILLVRPRFNVGWKDQVLNAFNKFGIKLFNSNFKLSGYKHF